MNSHAEGHEEGRQEEVAAAIDVGLDIIDSAISAYGPGPLFGLFSGGHDSLSATAITAKHPRFVSAVHINTGIGIEETREFVRETCRQQGWPLLEYGPPETIVGPRGAPNLTYEDLVMRWGFPGPSGHQVMYHRLKERALEQLTREHKSKKGRILLSSGIRHGESTRRMRNYGGRDPFYAYRGRIWANPIASWTKVDVNAFLDHEGLPRNRVVDLIHKSGECLCGAFAAKGEMSELEQWFPETAAYLHDLERRVQDAGHLRCVWESAGDDVHRDQTRMFPILPLCSSCEARA